MENASAKRLTDDPLEEVVLADETVWKGSFLKVERQTILGPKGLPSTREFLRHPGASAIVVLTDDGDVLLERQWRSPLYRSFYEIPAGKIDPGEDPFDCARRELREETGYTARQWLYLGVIHNAIGYSNEHIEIYLARGIGQQGERHLDRGEWLDVLRMPLKEALAACCDGRITDVKTIAGLFWAEKVLSGAMQGKPLATPV